LQTYLAAFQERFLVEAVGWKTVVDFIGMMVKGGSGSISLPMPK
jgi:hypothetical protein